MNADLQHDLAEVIKHAAETLQPDEVRLLCFGCGIDATEVLPAPQLDDLFEPGHF
jgi:hypothetical protein